MVVAGGIAAAELSTPGDRTVGASGGIAGEAVVDGWGSHHRSLSVLPKWKHPVSCCVLRKEMTVLEATWFAAGWTVRQTHEAKTEGYRQRVLGSGKTA